MDSGRSPSLTPYASEGADARLLQQRHGLEERQTHDTTVTAFQALHEHPTQSLDAVGSGLVGRLAGGPVGLRLGGQDDPETHLALAQGGGDPPGSPQGYSR